MRKIETFVAVNAIIENHGRVLLTRRSKSIREPGKWCLPGGHVEFGETWLQSLERELQEEIGVGLVAPSLLGVYSDPALTVTEGPVRVDGAVPVFGHFVVAVFTGRHVGSLKLSAEVDAIDWFAPDNLPTPIIRSHPIRVRDYGNREIGVVR